MMAMRPSLISYFQRKNVPPPHDDDLVDETVGKVWDRYYAGGNIEDRKAYTYMVAKSVLVRYLEGPRVRELMLPEGDDATGGGGGQDIIDARIDEQKAWDCFEECRRKLVDKGKFPKKIMDAAVEYLLIEGHDEARRNALAQRCGMSRKVFEQKVQKVKVALINCARDCLRRTRKNLT